MRIHSKQILVPYPYLSNKEISTDSGSPYLPCPQVVSSSFQEATRRQNKQQNQGQKMPDANTEENTISLCSVTLTDPLGTYTEKHGGSNYVVCNVTPPLPPLLPPCPGPFIALSPCSFPQPRIGSREQRLMLFSIGSPQGGVPSEVDQGSFLLL